jgi:hypothetical protein
MNAADERCKKHIATYTNGQWMSKQLIFSQEFPPFAYMDIHDYYLVFAFISTNSLTSTTNRNKKRD